MVIFLSAMILCGSLFTGLGIYAMTRKKPIWFWSGSSVAEDEITDVRAYNRANGIMWLAFSGIYWISAVLVPFYTAAALIVVSAGTIAGIPALAIAYSRIYKKYKTD